MPGIRKILQEPHCVLRKLLAMGVGNWLPDKPYLQLMYYAHFGRKLDLKDPKTFNEKLQWLKLYDRKSQYTPMVDKYEAKRYVAEKIGEEYIIPTLGVWEHFDEIDFDALPDQFVLKCTHDSGGLVIVKDKSSLDMQAAKKKIEQCLKRNYYSFGREWPYKNVKPRIIAEKFMVDESGTELKDYKFFVFSGEPKLLFIATDRGIDTRFDFYDMDFNHLPVLNGHPNAVKPIRKPESFEQMKTLAGILAGEIPQLRVDFYDVNGHIYFGELTFSHWSGFVPFEPDEWDRKIGDMVTLPAREK